jgi:hypothetical protein
VQASGKTNFPDLIRWLSPAGETRFSLGDPLVDSYLEFAGRTRPNTLRAVAFDLSPSSPSFTRTQRTSSPPTCSTFWLTSAVIARWCASLLASRVCLLARSPAGSLQCRGSMPPWGPDSSALSCRHGRPRMGLMARIKHASGAKRSWERPARTVGPGRHLVSCRSSGTSLVGIRGRGRTLTHCAGERPAKAATVRTSSVLGHGRNGRDVKVVRWPGPPDVM